MGATENLDQLRRQLRQPAMPRRRARRLHVQVHGVKSVNGLGVAALVLGIGAASVCWIPLVGVIAVPTAVLGLLFGVIGLMASLVGGKSGAGLPISGCVVCAVALILGIGAFHIGSDAMSGNGTGRTTPGRIYMPKPRVTYSEFKQIQTGMSYASVVRILGCEGQEEGRAHVEGIPGVMPAVTIVSYRWQNSDFSNMSVTFENDRANMKVQFGLR